MPSIGAVISAGPHPSLAVVKHWKGIVEIIIRGVAAVSFFKPLSVCFRVGGTCF